jgi:hypothetical protein
MADQAKRGTPSALEELAVVWAPRPRTRFERFVPIPVALLGAQVRERVRLRRMRSPFMQG